MIETLRRHWFSNVRADVLSGLVVALALIPEALAFSVIAGVDPAVGLYASFSMAVVIAIAGGRPAMISAATGAMALLMVGLVRDHGLQYLLAATILTGILQILWGVLRLGNLMRFVSRSVVTGFVNALAILIFMAQIPELTGENARPVVYAIALGGLAIIYLFPRVPKIGRIIPSPMVCIIVMTAVSMIMGLNVHQVGDMGELPDSLPIFLLPDIPWNFETLQIIFPTALTLSVVGLLESMMTATIVDDLTDTGSDKNRECRGQGIANIATGFLGGMAGCGMIGQTVINVKSGGRTRLSTMVAGIGVLVFVVFLGPWVAQIPMAALAAVMIMVSIGTFDWTSIRDIPKKPLTTNIVMLATVAVVVATHNLALGVLVGVLLASLFFANKIGRILHIDSALSEEDSQQRIYRISGQVFFASSTRFADAFDLKEDIDRVRIDVSQAHFWDITAVEILDRIVMKFRREGTEVEVIGLNEASQTMVDRFGVHDKTDGIIEPGGH
ncbi:SulP family inorganic anion transporter [Kushneria phosphatilytica]|uniref:SulP family inorganic anion transporter n=1 Tax=Kushneria phosphatilytica TaxID=657387 RepID=A0A1S1NTS5_9GAMM|nr:SulP family inorganic anion transporter [Kushneria phosphatilytica]OHV10541.1 sodium-independent anion transporter [Kushneria phosphatilytica]QEL11888.1 SulP family inorganic anion transporter [Kushneria phosphatilytica]